MDKELARLTIVEADGSLGIVIVDITGPVVEQVKIMDWARAQVEKDGGKIVHVQFGTKQAGVFKEENRRRVPAIVNGWHRMSAFLRS